MITFESLLTQIDYKYIFKNLSDTTANYYGINLYDSNIKLQPNIIYLCSDDDLKNISCSYTDIGIIGCGSKPKINKEKFKKIDFAYFNIDIPIKKFYEKIQNEYIQLSNNETNLSVVTKSLITGHGIKELINISSKIIDNPIILTTSSYKVLAMCNNGLNFDDPVWSDALLYGYCSSDSIKKFEEEGVTSKVHNNEDTYVLTTGLGKEIPRALKKISINNRVCAYIGVYEITRKFTKKDLKFIDLLCDIIAVELKLSNDEMNFTNIIYESIIIDLLKHNIKTQKVLNDRLKTSNWKLKDRFKCVLLSSESKEDSLYNKDYIIKKLNQDLYDEKIITYNNYILILFNYSGNNIDIRKYKILKEISEKFKMIVSISKEFNDLISLDKYYQSCVKLINIRNLLSIDKKVVSFEDLINYYLIENIPEYNLELLISNHFMKLLKFDSHYNVEYIKTLSTYIECACNTKNAADNLFIHRNTMTHRLNKIEEISGINLKNGKDLFSFYLSIFVYNWIKK